MDSKYIKRIFYETYKDVVGFYDALEWVDHRGVIEFRTHTFDVFHKVVKAVESRGWESQSSSQPKRLLICAEFDCKGTDFGGFRVTIGLKELGEWRLRYKGQVRAPVPELTEALNQVVNGTGSMGERLDRAIRAQDAHSG